MIDPRIRASQKHRDVLAAYWPRRISPYITAALLRTPITPNQTTVLWGIISAANSYVVYLVLTGQYILLPAVPLVYIFTYILDCSDGELARVRGISSPVAGKLLDGISHRATEFSLLMAYGAAAETLTGSPWVVGVALLLVSGEAMQVYAYERRLTTLRVELGFKGLMTASEDGVYQRDEEWRQLSFRRKVATLKGQVHQRSVYLALVLSYVSGYALLAGLAFLALYKHLSWMRLIARTLAQAKAAELRGATAPPPSASPAVASAAQSL
jgi:phosphatidylglycerophosphate synthase